MDKEVSHCRNFVTLSSKPNFFHWFIHTHTLTHKYLWHTHNQDILSHAACTPSSHPVRCWWGGFGQGISLSSSHHAVPLSDQWLTIAPGLQPQQGLWITYWQSCVRWTKHTEKKKNPHSCVGSAGENTQRSDPPWVPVIICYPSHTSLSQERQRCLSWERQRHTGLSTLTHCC